MLTLEEKFQARRVSLHHVFGPPCGGMPGGFALGAAAADEPAARRPPPQGGTGVNLTPPPPSLVPPAALAAARRRLALAAEALGVEGFARLDAFVHVDSGEVVVIEANAVPGMTPSTVLFHQALAEEPPWFPGEFLKAALDRGIERRLRRAAAAAGGDASA